jgi:hypothetical protein
MAAYAAALVWLAVASRGNWWAKIGTGAALYAAFLYASDNLAHLGQFAAREGSDEFRAQIDAATFAKVDITPWYGMGLSEATARIANGTRWFFHNSYAALYVEGGVVMTVVVLALYGGVLIALARRGRGGLGGAGSLWAWLNAPAAEMDSQRRFPRLAVAAAIGAVLLCALRLGEVFIAQVGFLVVGVGLALLLEDRPFTASPWAPQRAR